MASVILESPGWGSVTSVTSVTPLLHYSKELSIKNRGPDVACLDS